MQRSAAGWRSVLTLALATLLHAFTHAYWTILLPLYVLIQQDLGLAGVKMAAVIVAVYGLAYCLSSYGSGILADRFDRRLLLGVGLIGNAAAVLLMGLTRPYEMLLVLAATGGVFGALFHPAANALVTAHFPRSPGMAVGLLGIGAGIGFYAGPSYAGWRAATATWHWAQAASWQKPLVELGLLGVVCGVLFMLLAREVPAKQRPKAQEHPPMGRRLRWRVAAIAAVLGMRDLSGAASASLVSIYLLRAQGFDAARTGMVLGTMMLLAVVANPTAVYFSGRRRRLPTLAGMLVLGAMTIVTIPFLPPSMILPVLCLFQTLHLGSYAVGDAGILERIPAQVRGRVVGLLITIAGTLASSGPWIMGAWSDALGEHGQEPAAYVPLFAAVGGAMLVAACGSPLIARLGAIDEHAIAPLSEIDPATMEPAA
jgi:MFS family permease